MPDLPLGAVTLHYEIGGEGLPLLLVPGLASDSLSWGPLVQPLTRRFTVIRPDLRGTGRTLPRSAELSLPHYAADLAGLIGALGLGAVHLCGHSMGGVIAMQLAADRPDLVRSLTLLASGPERSARNQHILDGLVALRAAAPPEAWLDAFYPWLFRPAFFDDPENIPAARAAALAYPYAQGPDEMRRQVEVMRRLDVSALPARIVAPVQAVLGAMDLLYPVEPTTRALRRAFPGIGIEVIGEAAHSVHWDAPGPVARALARFIADRADA